MGKGVSNWLYLIGSVCFFLGTLINMAHPRDLGQWENNPPEIREWYKRLMQPDNPIQSCCGESDAYWADSFEMGEDGNYVAIITDTRDDYPLQRPHINPGTKFSVPNSKIKFDQGNPTGHGVIFLAPWEDKAGYRHVYCYVPPGGV